MTIQELDQAVGACGIFYLATVDGNEPRVRPFGFHMVYDGRLYFGGGNQKAWFREVQSNPNVEICGFSKGGFLRIRGKAVLDYSDDVQTAMYQISPGLKKGYGPNKGQLHVPFYLEELSVMGFKGAEAEKLI